MKKIVFSFLMLFTLMCEAQITFKTRSVQFTPTCDTANTYSSCQVNKVAGVVVRYSSDSLLYEWTGKRWVALGGSGGGGFNPANLSTTTTGVSITGGTNAVNGSGTHISIQNATTSQTGLLTNTDWNTFNNKVDGTFSSTISPFQIPYANGLHSLTASNELVYYPSPSYILHLQGSTGSIDIEAGGGIGGNNIGGSTGLQLTTNSSDITLNPAGIVNCLKPLTLATLTTNGGILYTNSFGGVGQSSTFTWLNNILTANSVTLKSPAGSSSGDPNLFLGNGAGVTSPVNGRNVAFGYHSLNSLTSGSDNTAIGYGALSPNTTTNQNTALGAYALNQATATGNTAIGYLTMGNHVVTGSNNVAVGRSALSALTTGTLNVAVGDAAGNALQDGSQDTFVGRISGGANTSGTDNTFLGYAAGQNVTTSSENTFVGSTAGVQYINTTGRNTAVGVAALENGHNGTENTFVGYAAGSENGITGSYNTAIGSRTISQYGFSTGTSGNGNEAFGWRALESVKTGSYNIGIGHSVSSTDDPSVMITGGSQNIAIGYRANIADSAGNGQLSIQNAIYGTGNTLNGTGNQISQGKIGLYTKAPASHLTVKGITANNDPIFDVQTSGGTNAISVATNGSGVIIIKLNNLPTSCSGLSTGTLANVGGVLTICP